MTTPQLPYLGEPVDNSNPVIRAADLLSALIPILDIASGGPGSLGAAFIRTSDTTGEWSALDAEFLLDETGSILIDELNAYLVG